MVRTCILCGCLCLTGVRISGQMLCCGCETAATPQLTLPHPRAHLREFVLRPLCDLDPQLILPGQTLPAARLLEQLPAGPAVTPYPL